MYRPIRLRMRTMRRRRRHHPCRRRDLRPRLRCPVLHHLIPRPRVRITFRYDGGSRVETDALIALHETCSQEVIY
jgi:hypothetical protein